MIRRKSEYVALWHRGLLGNKLRSWDTILEIPKGFQKVMIRQKSRNGGGMAREALVRDLPRLTCKSPGNYFFNELAPDATAVLQGEVIETPILELFGHIRGPQEIGEVLRMRDILPRAERYKGLKALQILQGHLSPASMDDVRELLDLYPGHAIELSAYPRNLGLYQGRNTIIWEVRAY